MRYLAMKLVNKKILTLLFYYMVSIPIGFFGVFFLGQSWFVIVALLSIATPIMHWLTR
jgi:hypothetical protein